MRGRLVEHEQGGAGVDARERAGDREAPLLARAELRNRGVGDVPQPELGERGIRIRGAVERQLLARRARERPRGLRRPADERRIDALDRALDNRVGGQRAGERGEEGRLAGSAGAGDRDDAVEIRVQRAEHRRRASGVSDREPADPDAGRSGYALAGAPRVAADGMGEERLHAGQRREAGLRRMERGADVAQRGVDLRREDEREQRRLEGYVAIEQSQAEEDGDDGHRERRDELQRQRRQKGDAQGRERALAVLPLDPVERARLILHPAEPDEHWEAARELGEVIGEARERGCRLIGALLRVLADEDHEHRDERHGEHDDQGAHPVGAEDPQPDDERDRDGADHGRQALRVVVVEVVEALRGEHDDAALLLRTVGRGAARRDPAPQPRSQVALDGDGDPVRGHLRRPSGQGAQQGAGDAEDQDRAGVDRAGLHARDAARDGIGDEHEPHGPEHREHPEPHEPHRRHRPEIRSHRSRRRGARLCGPAGRRRRRGAGPCGPAGGRRRRNARAPGSACDPHPSPLLRQHRPRPTSPPPRPSGAKSPARSRARQGSCPA